MSEQDLFRLLGLSLSSPSASDLSEGVSDMSLSTSPGSDCPQHSRPPNALTNGKSTNGNGGETGSNLGNGDGGGGGGETEGGSKPRRRLVARQLSSNPYLASSSSVDDHNPATPSASFAFGENNQFEESPLPLRSCSFPAAGEFVENLAHRQQQQYNQIHNLSHHDIQPLSHDQYYSNVVNGNVHGYYPPPPTRTPCSNTRTTPPETVPHDTSSLPRSVNSWGHFSKSSYNRYKYRRSDYSSDSDEDSHPSPPQLPHKISSSSGSSAPQPHTCLSEYQHISSSSNRKKSATDTKKDHNHFSEGVRPNVFKERFAVSMVSNQSAFVCFVAMCNYASIPELELMCVQVFYDRHWWLRLKKKKLSVCEVESCC